MTDGSKINPQMCNRVADAIAGRTIPDLAFEMSSYVYTLRLSEQKRWASKRDHACGSSACIAGWTRMVDGTFSSARAMEEFANREAEDFYEYDGRDGSEMIHDGAALSLGLDPVEANGLFLGCTYATDEQAVAHLRDIARGEPVDWKRYLDMEDSSSGSTPTTPIAAG